MKARSLFNKTWFIPCFAISFGGLWAVVTCLTSGQCFGLLWSVWRGGLGLSGTASSFMINHSSRAPQLLGLRIACRFDLQQEHKAAVSPLLQWNAKYLFKSACVFVFHSYALTFSIDCICPDSSQNRQMLIHTHTHNVIPSQWTSLI